MKSIEHNLVKRLRLVHSEYDRGAISRLGANNEMHWLRFEFCRSGHSECIPEKRFDVLRERVAKERAQ